LNLPRRFPTNRSLAEGPYAELDLSLVILTCHRNRNTSVFHSNVLGLEGIASGAFDKFLTKVAIEIGDGLD